jgi:tetratricopeptide (TPR) repeat protein
MSVKDYFFERAGPPIAVFLTAFVLRFFYIFQFKDDPLLDCLFLDPLYYSNWATRIVAGDLLGGNEVYEMSPLYAYFLAFIYKYITTYLFTVRLIQIVIGSLSCVLIFSIAKVIFKSNLPALATGFAAAAYGPFILYDGIIMKTFLAVFFVLLMTMFLLKSERPSFGFPFLAGLFLSLAALIRENIILLIPVIPLWFLSLKEEPVGSRLLKGAFFLVGVFLIILPVTVRNFYVGGEFVLITSGGGEVFYLGNNPNADGTYKIPAFITPTPISEHEDFRTKARELTGKNLTRGESSRYWFHRGISYIIENPLDYAKLELKKLLLFWNFYEYPDNQNYYLHRTHSRVLGAPVVNFSAIAPLSMLGLFLSLSHFRKFAVLYFVFLAYLASFLMFFNYARFRLPAVPFLIIFGVYSIWWIAEKIKKRRFKPVFLSICVLIVFYIVVNLNMQDDDPYRFLFATSYSNLGLCYEKAGEDEKAIDYFRKSLGIKPTKIPALKGLGRIFLRRARYDLAEESYLKILEENPGFAEAHKWLGDTFAKAGKLDSAIAEYKKSIELEPENPIFYGDMGFVLIRKDLYAEAIGAFEEASKIKPDYARAYYGLSLSYMALGQNEKWAENWTIYKQLR